MLRPDPALLRRSAVSDLDRFKRSSLRGRRRREATDTPLLLAEKRHLKGVQNAFKCLSGESPYTRFGFFLNTKRQPQRERDREDLANVGQITKDAVILDHG
jgi:hypothetical protein